ncbi:MAG: aspartate-semialdehyde dehydrogenase [Candidatus Levybacteria bacterium RIFCSPHIGHO2_12_FULL_38_12]|nr:MAG: aspartate-semialdehyde dehydrogenase [Candidatus Levybacteria bacterium RIFCSPHIGHO2_12_FULL_38_12]OGH34032.1 MAG: aspartate-semialdehyde dehydrogenase [Candidatus Levybacteria bacterium RIFCSPLOWO2_01_FULL_37_20]OGH44891.1 MAG: aspartate-semialdehyde dehydrogenase [Candidatus Levybacteria bacterium RIFCSPLOWO2_02_FULL_37_18]
MNKKISVGILGATGMVGQRFVTLLANHPWFEIIKIAASPSSAGKLYKETVQDRWLISEKIPASISNIKLLSVQNSIDEIAKEVRIVFSALDMDKNEIKKIEEEYAKKGVFVVSNNSAHRWTPDVPMIIPEINPHHLKVIPYQRKKRGWKKGGIIVKSNCSIQSYVPILEAWKKFEPIKVIVTTQQALSGAGKTFKSWPEMIDNVIPFIAGEEEKSEMEPMKIWGTIKNGEIKSAQLPVISATCIRVAASDGHMASVSVKFKKKVTAQKLIQALRKYKNPIEKLQLPSSPKQFLTYFEEDSRPQSKLDRNLYGGMGISVGRIRPDSILDFKFVALSHNTIRGAAGGAVLAAELAISKNLI